MSANKPHRTGSRGRRRSVTIQDVADQAGVSHQTISRVLNNKAEVADATRSRVLSVIARLGYEPNTAARNLSLGRTNTIGLILPDVTAPFYPEVASHIELNARLSSYGLLLCNTRDGPEAEIGHLNMLRQQRVDGLILCASRLAPGRLQAIANGLGPCVLVNCLAKGPHVAAVRFDFADAAQRATRHLIALGHRRIGLVHNTRSRLSAIEKERGYIEALLDAGIPFDRRFLIPEESTVEGGIRALAKIIETKPTAVFVAGVMTGLGIVLACQQSGLRVPDDLAVVGFGDPAYAEAITPRLTTVSLPLQTLADRAMSTLVRLIHAGPIETRDDVLPTRLVVRSSCGSQAAAGSTPEGGQPVAEG